MEFLNQLSDRANPEARFRRLLTGDESSLLDVGAGHGGVFDFAEWVQRKPPLDLRVACDIFWMRPDIPGFELCKCDGAKLPFQDSSFDMVQCCEVLEHVPIEKQEGFLHELKRVSKGLVFVTTTNETAHLGPEQQRIEAFNRFQHYEGMPPPELFIECGYTLEYWDGEHIEAIHRRRD